MDTICGGKGEGVMIKDSKSKYEVVRSFSLLKVKQFKDAEAKVIDYWKDLVDAVGCVEQSFAERRMALSSKSDLA